MCQKGLLRIFFTHCNHTHAHLTNHIRFNGFNPVQPIVNPVQRVHLDSDRLVQLDLGGFHPGSAVRANRANFQPNSTDQASQPNSQPGLSHRPARPIIKQVQNRFNSVQLISNRPIRLSRTGQLVTPVQRVRPDSFSPAAKPAVNSVHTGPGRFGSIFTRSRLNTDPVQWVSGQSSPLETRSALFQSSS